MTEFEKELERAIEYGCPCMNMPGYFDHYDDDEQKLDCAYCHRTLWTVENGWIPELQEIVKGE